MARCQSKNGVFLSFRERKEGRERERGFSGVEKELSTCEMIKVEGFGKERETEREKHLTEDDVWS